MKKKLTDDDRKWISERSTEIMEQLCIEKYGPLGPGKLFGYFVQGFKDGFHVVSMRQALEEWKAK